jgi:hypothetical protein
MDIPPRSGVVSQRTADVGEETGDLKIAVGVVLF